MVKILSIEVDEKVRKEDQKVDKQMKTFVGVDEKWVKEKFS